jgi:hypothetical protein
MSNKGVGIAPPASTTFRARTARLRPSFDAGSTAAPTLQGTYCWRALHQHKPLAVTHDGIRRSSRRRVRTHHAPAKATRRVGDEALPQARDFPKRMRQRANGAAPVAPLLGKVGDNRRAALFREHLTLAGVDRPRIFEDTATTIRINFRSLRDSGITWEALAGTPVDRIQSRAGHEHIATTLGYVKAVEDLRGKFGAPFAPLSFCAPPATSIGPRIGPSDRSTTKMVGASTGYKLRLLDSNQRPGG